MSQMMVSVTLLRKDVIAFKVYDIFEDAIVKHTVSKLGHFPIEVRIRSDTT